MYINFKKDYLVRKYFKFFEKKKVILKNFFLNKKIPYILRIYSFFLLNNLMKNSLKVRTINMCIFSSRKHGVFKFFSLSRLMIKKLGSYKNIPGLRKYSW